MSAYSHQLPPPPPGPGPNPLGSTGLQQRQAAVQHNHSEEAQQQQQYNNNFQQATQQQEFPHPPSAQTAVSGRGGIEKPRLIPRSQKKDHRAYDPCSDTALAVLCFVLGGLIFCSIGFGIYLTVGSNGDSGADGYYSDSGNYYHPSDEFDAQGNKWSEVSERQRRAEGNLDVWGNPRAEGEKANAVEVHSKVVAQTVDRKVTGGDRRRNWPRVDPDPNLEEDPEDKKERLKEERKKEMRENLLPMSLGAAGGHGAAAFAIAQQLKEKEKKKKEEEEAASKQSTAAAPWTPPPSKRKNEKEIEEDHSEEAQKLQAEYHIDGEKFTYPKPTEYNITVIIPWLGIVGNELSIPENILTELSSAVAHLGLDRKPAGLIPWGESAHFIISMQALGDGALQQQILKDVRKNCEVLSRAQTQLTQKRNKQLEKLHPSSDDTTSMIVHREACQVVFHDLKPTSSGVMAELMNAGARAAPQDTSHFLFLSPGHIPRNPETSFVNFLDHMMFPFVNGTFRDTVKMVGATTGIERGKNIPALFADALIQGGDLIDGAAKSSASQKAGAVGGSGGHVMEKNESIPSNVPLSSVSEFILDQGYSMTIGENILNTKYFGGADSHLEGSGLQATRRLYGHPLSNTGLRQPTTTTSGDKKFKKKPPSSPFNLAPFFPAGHLETIEREHEDDDTSKTGSNGFDYDDGRTGLFSDQSGIPVDAVNAQATIIDTKHFFRMKGFSTRIRTIPDLLNLRIKNGDQKNVRNSVADKPPPPGSIIEASSSSSAEEPKKHVGEAAITDDALRLLGQRVKARRLSLLDFLMSARRNGEYPTAPDEVLGRKLHEAEKKQKENPTTYKPYEGLEDDKIMYEAQSAEFQAFEDAHELAVESRSFFSQVGKLTGVDNILGEHREGGDEGSANRGGDGNYRALEVDNKIKKEEQDFKTSKAYRFRFEEKGETFRSETSPSEKLSLLIDRLQLALQTARIIDIAPDDEIGIDFSLRTQDKYRAKHKTYIASPRDGRLLHAKAPVLVVVVPAAVVEWKPVEGTLMAPGGSSELDKAHLLRSLGHRALLSTELSNSFIELVRTHQIRFSPFQRKQIISGVWMKPRLLTDLQCDSLYGIGGVAEDSASLALSAIIRGSEGVIDSTVAITEGVDAPAARPYVLHDCLRRLIPSAGYQKMLATRSPKTDDPNTMNNNNVQKESPQPGYLYRSHEALTIRINRVLSVRQADLAPPLHKGWWSARPWANPLKQVYRLDTRFCRRCAMEVVELAASNQLNSGGAKPKSYHDLWVTDVNVAKDVKKKIDEVGDNIGQKVAVHVVPPAIDVDFWSPASALHPIDAFEFGVPTDARRWSKSTLLRDRDNTQQQQGGKRPSRYLPTGTGIVTDMYELFPELGRKIPMYCNEAPSYATAGGTTGEGSNEQQQKAPPYKNRRERAAYELKMREKHDTRPFTYFAHLGWDAAHGWAELFGAYRRLGEHQRSAPSGGSNDNNDIFLLVAAYLPKSIEASQLEDESTNSAVEALHYMIKELKVWNRGQDLDSRNGAGGLPPFCVVVDDSTHMGGFHQEELLRFYKSADAFVQPGRGDLASPQFGIPVLKALALQIPVISYQTAGQEVDFLQEEWHFRGQSEKLHSPETSMTIIPETMDAWYRDYFLAFPRGGLMWANIEAEDLAHPMVDVLSAATDMGEDFDNNMQKARRYVVEHHAYEVVARTVETRLDEMLERFRKDQDLPIHGENGKLADDSKKKDSKDDDEDAGGY